MSVNVVDRTNVSFKKEPETNASWNNAVLDARRLGIQWQRPKGDNRSASDIIADNALLKNLGNQSGVKDMLKAQVGDYENDADAAYRAEQVLEHIEMFDENGDRIAAKTIGNGRVDGFTKDGEARHGTEAGRLQDFGKYGFSFLKGEFVSPDVAATNPQSMEQAQALGIDWERSEGDTRSAQEIIDDTPLLKNLGNQSDVKDMLKEQVGDFETDADAAYRAAQVLTHIERYDSDGNRVAGKNLNNGKIDGFTNSGEAKPDTEAARLQDFGKYGFSSLQGEIRYVEDAAGNSQSREAAQAKGIMWELPDGDTRTAQDIIEQSPLLRDLGNQSGLSDMLKEQVGDFEQDADAAFRANQVLERVVMYDAKGNNQTGNNAANQRIDGVTKSGEAKHNTEAGRLQDFGKYGFESLPDAKKPEDMKRYQDFLKANPDADDASRQLAKYTVTLKEYFHVIRSKNEKDIFLTRDDIQRYRDSSPQLSDEVKEALDFWLQPGSFKDLETSLDRLTIDTDGLLTLKDIDAWLDKYAPATPEDSSGFISDVAVENISAGQDTAHLDSDIFRNPQNYSVQERAAAIQDLAYLQKLLTEGKGAGLWKGGDGEKLSEKLGSSTDPEEILDEVTEKIDLLMDDEVTKYLEENTDTQLEQMFERNPGLKEALESTYHNVIHTDDVIDDLWKQHTKDGKTNIPAVLTDYVNAANSLQNVLGIEGEAATTDIQDAIKNSRHLESFKDYYEDNIVTGKRYKDLLAEEDGTFAQATSTFSMEMAAFSAAMPADYTEAFDEQLQQNFSEIAQENVFNDATFEDLKKAFAIEGTDDLDEEKLASIIDQIKEENPEFLINPDGSVPEAADIIKTVRNVWDSVRNGGKTLKELKLFDKSSPIKGIDKVTKQGVMHGVSGLLMAGVTIAKGVSGAGNLSEKDIVDISTGSIQAATTMMEGGGKRYESYLEVAQKSDSRWNNMEGADANKIKIEQKIERAQNNYVRATKGFAAAGNLAGIAAGAYGIFDGVQALRRGDKAQGGINITSGALGIMAGLVSGIENAIGVFGMVAPSIVSAAAGALGVVGAVFGAVSFIVMAIINAVKHDQKVDKYGDLLENYMSHYDITGLNEPQKAGA